MGALVSAEMKHALHLIKEEGKSTYEAAKLAGVFPSSVYKALNKIDKKNRKKKLDKRVA